LDELRPAEHPAAVVLAAGDVVRPADDAAGLGGATWYCIGQSCNDPVRNTNAPAMTSTLGIFLADGYTKLADNGADLADGPMSCSI
jgi:hypothetical protein